MPRQLTGHGVGGAAGVVWIKGFAVLRWTDVPLVALISYRFSTVYEITEYAAPYFGLFLFHFEAFLTLTILFTFHFFPVLTRIFLF